MLSEGGARGRPVDELGGKDLCLGVLARPSDIMKPASLEATAAAILKLTFCVVCRSQNEGCNGNVSQLGFGEVFWVKDSDSGRNAIRVCVAKWRAAFKGGRDAPLTRIFATVV